MVNLTKKSANVVVILALYVISLLLIIFVAGRLLSVKDQFIQTRTNIANLNNDLAKLDKIVEDEKKNENAVKEIMATLPSSYSDVSKFAQTLEKAAKDSGSSIEVSIDKETKKEKALSTLGFSVKTKGDYTSLKNTMALLSQLPYHTSVDSLKVDTEGGELTTLVHFKLFMK